MKTKKATDDESEKSADDMILIKPQKGGGLERKKIFYKREV